MARESTSGGTGSHPPTRRRPGRSARRLSAIGLATALVALGLTAPASAEDGTGPEAAVTVESTTEPVVAMEPAPEVEAALPPAEPIAEAPAPEEPMATTDPVQTEPVQTDPVQTEPVVAESGGTSTTTTPAEAVTVAGTDPVAAAEGDVPPATTGGSTQTQLTPATGVTGDGGGLTTSASEEVFDGQGTGEDVPVLESLPSPSTSAPSSVTLAAPSSIAVAPTGWTNPVIGRLTSAFGLRVHPVLGTFGAHAGQDLATRCGSPVYAAAGGVVVWAAGALQGRTGNQLVIAHGDGVITRYGHLLTGTLLVKQGDTVQAGQRVASVGGDRSIDPLGAGNSTGCHLHFEVNLSSGATPVDPLAFLLARGIRLGSDEPVVVVAPVEVAGVIVPAAPTVATEPVLDLAALEAMMGPRLPVVAIRAVG